MKKYALSLLVTIAIASLLPQHTHAAVNGVVTVGLRWGATALASANLENHTGSGYALGYFDDRRTFVPLTETDRTTITMTADSGGVTVTETNSGEVLYRFDRPGQYLGVLPRGEDTLTWFKGNRYPGGFVYRPEETGLTVINVVDLEEYVRGVVPYEMDRSWPLAALEAQAVCARTYAAVNRHPSLGFDVCAGTDCQVYYGLGSRVSAQTDLAVANTAGQMLLYDGAPIRTAVYCASNGGASEDVANVWGSDLPYLCGKEDPYEAMTTIPNYRWSVTYTPGELTAILTQKGYDVGTVRNVYVEEYTPTGNVKRVRFEGDGGNVTVQGETCRLIFYSSALGKSVRSQRFTISGGNGPEVFSVAGGGILTGLTGLSVISGQGVRGTLGAALSILTARGRQAVEAPGQTADVFTVTGSGSGHNLGMSQYGAKAMAEAGYGYRDILQFYYTGVTIGQEAA